MKNRLHRKDAKYWYVFYLLECPVCGNGDKYKVRVFKKPSSKLTYIYMNQYMIIVCINRE